MVGQFADRHIEHRGPGGQQGRRHLLQGPDLYRQHRTAAVGGPGVGGGVAVEGHLRQLAPQGRQPDQRFPAQTVDHAGRNHHAGGHLGLDLTADVGGTAGFGKACCQFFFCYRAADGLLGHGPLGPAHMAGPVGHQQRHRAARLHISLEPHRNPGYLAGFVAGAGLGQQLFVFPFAGTDAQHGAVHLILQIPVGKALARENTLELLQVLAGDGLTVQGRPVNAGRHGHIFRPLHTALQLQGVDAHGFQLQKVLNGAVVLETQGVLLLIAAIAAGETAGLGALAPVAAAPSDDGGKVTLSGVAHAEGAVAENFDFHGAFPADGGNFALRQLPGQDHPAAAQFGRQLDAVQIVNAHLGAGVDLHRRGNFPAHGNQAQVLDDKGVHAQLGRPANQLRRFGQLPVGGQGVQRQVDPDAADMTIGDGLPEIVQSEIPGAHAGVEAAGAQINGIRAVLDRGPQGLHGACGG